MKLTKEEFEEIVVQQTDVYRMKKKEPFILAIINGKIEFDVIRFFPDLEEAEILYPHPKMWGVQRCFDLRKELYDKTYNVAETEEKE